MNRFKKWLLSIVCVMALFFATTAALVIYVDPFFQYHAPLGWFPYLVDNQLSQNPGMAKHMEYDSVILGSSMTVNFNTVWFDGLTCDQAQLQRRLSEGSVEYHGADL